MRSILIRSETKDRETLITKLWECGTTGIIEYSDTLQAFFEDDSSVPWIVQQLSCPVLEVTDKADLAYASNSSLNRDPVYAGRRFFIVSPDMDPPAPPSRKRLTIDVNDSFGSGRHESTQLAIQVLEEYLPLNATVLDVGCGSGILSAIAHELGAAQVFACDTHIGALSSARKNSPNSQIFAGSIDSLASSSADVVIVNISASVIDRLTDELHRVIKPAGLVILAGFTTDRTPARICPKKVFQLNEWLCWLCCPGNIQSVQARGILQPFPAQWW